MYGVRFPMTICALLAPRVPLPALVNGYPRSLPYSRLCTYYLNGNSEEAALSGEGGKNTNNKKKEIFAKKITKILNFKFLNFFDIILLQFFTKRNSWRRVFTKKERLRPVGIRWQQDPE